MEYRHEWKHVINYGDMLALRMRLGAVMKRDSHAVNGRYDIRSLYFDTPTDKALREKLDGVSRREKFRIRYYNGDISHIQLEKKSRLSGLGSKESAPLTAEQAQGIAEGRTAWMADSGEPLVRELYAKMTTERLEARTIVDYTREPFVYEPGNVRVTLDYDIRTGWNCTEFLNPDCITVPAGDRIILLEVKWDEFLPSVIRDAVQLPDCRSTAFSKYAQCRIYG